MIDDDDDSQKTQIFLPGGSRPAPRPHSPAGDSGAVGRTPQTAGEQRKFSVHEVDFDITSNAHEVDFDITSGEGLATDANVDVGARDAVAPAKVARPRAKPAVRPARSSRIGPVLIVVVLAIVAYLILR